MLLSYTTLAAGAFGLWVIYYLGWCIYALYFHPLAKYPGPRFAAISDLWYVWTWTAGRYPFVMRAMHDKYGEVFRMAPNELSFSTAQSVRDIYMSKGNKTFLKSEIFYTNHDPDVGMGFEISPAKHVEKRKRFAPPLSAAGVKAQESMFHKYIDMFIGQMIKISNEQARGVNISASMDWLTFDIMGEVAFGESFNATEEGKTHFWTSVVVESGFYSLLAGFQKRIPWIAILFPFIIPPSAIKMFKRHTALTQDKVRKRIAMGGSDRRADLFSQVVEDHLAGKLPEGYLCSEAMILMIAGAETTATCLAACLFYLSKDQDLMCRLKNEIRGRFDKYSDIDGLSTSTLPLLNAVLEEGLRLYTPAALGLPRVSPGATVDGHFIPAGVVVSTQLWVQSHYEFDDPDSFRPERWLKNGPTVMAAEEGTATAKHYPFSAGTRVCLGQTMAMVEMRLALAKMVWALDWEMVEGPADYVMESSHQFLWKKPATWMRFRRVES